MGCLYSFLARVLSFLSCQQTGIRGALQDCARWELRTGVAGGHEVLNAEYSSIRDYNCNRKLNILCFFPDEVFKKKKRFTQEKLMLFDPFMLLYPPMMHSVACLLVCSTNGTLINMSKLVKRQTYMLQNGDVIHFVYKKSEPEQSKFLNIRLCFYMNWSEAKADNDTTCQLFRHCLCVPFNPNGASHFTTKLW